MKLVITETFYKLYDQKKSVKLSFIVVGITFGRDVNEGGEKEKAEQQFLPHPSAAPPTPAGGGGGGA